MSESENTLVSEYIEWFKSTFGEKFGNDVLNLNAMYKTGKFNFKKYNRIEPINTNFTKFSISGWAECFRHGLNLRNQDAPGFICSLYHVKYVLIGLEVNQKDFDYHIAYDYYPANGSKSPIFDLYEIFFPDIRVYSYITDIAKCRTKNLNLSRKICKNNVLLKELALLLRFNPEIIFILQGTGVREFFNEYIYEEKKIMSKKTPNKQLFSYTFIQFEKHQVLTYIFPHSSDQNRYLWNELKNLSVKDEIIDIIDNKKIPSSLK